MEAETQSQLEATLGHRFEDPARLRLALTHPSCERPEGDNQRLEFIGDAVLDLVIAERLFEAFPQSSEGTLDRFRASIVNGQSVAQTAANIGLAQYLEVGEAHRRHQPEASEAMLEDALEAVIGAIFMDGGLDAARGVVSRLFAGPLAACHHEDSAIQGNPKGRLQEWSQRKHGGELPQYDLVATEGQDHERRYTARVSIAGRSLAEGCGRSIKAAEIDAASRAMEAID
jgi:ribonuclease-3